VLSFVDSCVSRMVEVLRAGCCLSSQKDRILCSGDTDELTLIQGKGINFLRASPRPFWPIISALIFGFSAFTYIYSWWLQAFAWSRVFTFKRCGRHGTPPHPYPVTYRYTLRKTGYPIWGGYPLRYTGCLVSRYSKIWKT
jgi:hypothetical protein